MHEKLQERIDFIAEKFNLSDFHLKRYHFFKEKGNLKEITYILNMEWFPNDIIDNNLDYNPPGTISIDIDFHSMRLKNFIFVEGINQTEANLPESTDIEAAIKWIEQESGLEFGQQFKRVNNGSSDLTFLAAAENITVFPPGYIQLEFNEHGKVSLYSIHGEFPGKDKINREPFTLTETQTKEIVKNHYTQLEIPVVDEEKWLNVYAVSTCFISNDGKRILSYEEVESDFSYTALQTVLEWDVGEQKEFPTKEIDISMETTLEAALENDKEGFDQIINEDEKQKAITMVQAYLQSFKPDDSGEWKITSLRREENYLFAVLKLATEEISILNRKITIILDANTLQPVNHVDNEGLLDTFKGYTEADAAKLTIDEAFDMLYNYIEITPIYVYDKHIDRHVLCGKVDCEYAIDATTGELIVMDELN